MNTKASIRSAALSIVLIAAVTIGSELSSALKQLLSSIGGHHWIGKSILSLLAYAVLYLVFARVSEGEFRLKDTWMLIAAVVISGLAILFFYIQHA